MRWAGGSVPQFIGGEKVWRMTVDSTTNQIVEAIQLAESTGFTQTVAWFC
jgi:hypothetical protein